MFTVSSVINCNQTEELQSYCKAVNMKRQWQYNPLSHSSASQTVKIAFNTYSYSNIPPRMQSKSKQKSIDKSREKIYSVYPNFGQKVPLNTYKSPENSTLKELPIYEYKQNPVKKDIEAVTQRVRELQTRLLEYQHRVDTLERSSRNTAKLSTSLEEFMRNQYADLKERERLEERLTTFQQALGHMATIKADRKDLQNVDVGRCYALGERLNQLQSENSRLDHEILEVNDKFQRVFGKIETNLMSMGQKYEEFIQSNIIKTIDHVNKLTQHYHGQIQELNRSQTLMNEKIETLHSAAIDELSKAQKKIDLSTSIIGISLPGLRIVQSLIIKDERKVKGLNSFKQRIKQQHKDSITNIFGVQNSSISTNNSQICNNLSDTLQSNMANTSIEISLQKVIYKLDRQFNLLDQNDHYLLNESGGHIRLNQKHISLLKQQGVIQWQAKIE